MMLTTEQQVTYERIRQTALAELEELDRDIAAELVRVKKRLLELQESRRAVIQILDGASARLGLPRAPAAAEINLSDLSQAADTENAPAAAAERLGISGVGIYR